MNSRIRTVLLVLATGAAGCGADDSIGCGTEENPATLRIADRVPAIGATVLNGHIDEAFTLKDAFFYLYPLEFDTLAPLHTAGRENYDTYAPSRWSETDSGKDVKYWRQVPSWSSAPGHVALVPLAGWKTDSGCYYKLPSPLLSYDVTPW